MQTQFKLKCSAVCKRTNKETVVVCTDRRRLHKTNNVTGSSTELKTWVFSLSSFSHFYEQTQKRAKPKESQTPSAVNPKTNDAADEPLPFCSKLWPGWCTNK